jgi:AraC-like DNA-binding protein
MHSHCCVALHGCLEGPVSLLTEAGEQVLDTGVFYLLAPGLRHQWQNTRSHTATTIGLLIDTDRFGPWPNTSGLRDCCRKLRHLVHGLHRFGVRGDAELQQVFWKVADHLTADQPREQLTTTGLLCTLLGLVVERLGPGAEVAAPDDPAHQIRRLLLTRVNERLSIKEVVAHVGLSPTRAMEVFRATYGCGIIAYFNRLKIWQAKQLLCDPALTVDQVSCRLGFSSPSYFSRAFHHYTGESPTEFRGRQG